MVAWVQVSHGNADIAAVFKTATGNETAATAIAQQGCWSMLKGGIVVNASAQYELLFEVFLFLYSFIIIVVVLVSINSYNLL